MVRSGDFHPSYRIYSIHITHITLAQVFAADYALGRLAPTVTHIFMHMFKILLRPQTYVLCNAYLT